MRNLLLSRYPHLATLPDDATLDTPLPPAPDLDWAASEWGIPPSPIPVDGDSSSVGGGWADVALWIGGEMMEHVRGEVETELGYTTSAGIAHNKILAKVCSAYKKPRAQVRRFVLRGIPDVETDFPHPSDTDGPSHFGGVSLPSTDGFPEGWSDAWGRVSAHH